ncbi:MAG: aminopeptidase P family N-terminal domain-containing protein, partial [Methylocystis sp.]|nr:aminopeptidase P family N-terminal domain-containing protein [Methylocystis sp.]
MFECKFQTFVDQSSTRESAARLAALRAELARAGVDGYLVPHADEHQNEYVPKCAERLAWLTGFTGSAGFAIVLAEQAALFVDGRYALQARDQIDASRFAPLDVGATAPSKWLAEHTQSGAKIGYDPWLHTPARIERFAAALEGKNVSLIALAENPIDAVWLNRPPPPRGAVSLYPPRFAGQSAKAKIARVRKALDGADALFVSDPHALAWVFNIRGADVAHTPIALGFALLPKDGKPRLYVDAVKLSARTGAALEKFLKIEEPAAMRVDLERAGNSGETIRFDSSTVPSRLVQLFREAGGTPRLGEDPIALLKAVKNDTELEGARAANLRDGAALTRFLAWFEGQAPNGELTEIEAARALETFRRDGGDLRDVSFPTISAFGPHAAIPHYRVTEK